MDDRPDTVLTAHDVAFVGDCDAQVRTGGHGVFLHGARMLSRYAWRWWTGAGAEPRTLQVDATLPDVVHVRYVQADGPSPTVALRRTLRAHGHGLVDEVEVANASHERRSLSLELDVAAVDGADASDPPEAGRGHPPDPASTVAEVDATSLTLRRTSSDGVASALHLRFGELAAARPDGADWELSLAPGERVLLRVTVDLERSDATRPGDPVDDAG